MASSYEEERRRRVAENKKKLTELGIVEAAKGLSSKPSAPKHTVVKRQPVPLEAIRRSSRVSSTQRVNYSELEMADPLPRRSSSRTRTAAPRCYSDKTRFAAIQAAEEIQANLNCPSAMKVMLQSHVSGGFWLSLPVRFCQQHMPKVDTTMILEDNEEEESESLYLAYKNGLSGGWRGFAIDHELQAGDALVFELREPTRLKVHIIRVGEAEAEEESDSERKKLAFRPKPKKRPPVPETPRVEEKRPAVVCLDDDSDVEVLETRPLANYQPVPVCKRTRGSLKRLTGEVLVPKPTQVRTDRLNTRVAAAC